MSSRPGPSPLETAALQLLEQRDENDSIISAILPALQVLVSGAYYSGCRWSQRFRLASAPRGLCFLVHSHFVNPTGDSTTAVQSHALDQLSSWLTEYRSFKSSQQLDSVSAREIASSTLPRRLSHISEDGRPRAAQNLTNFTDNINDRLAAQSGHFSPHKPAEMGGPGALHAVLLRRPRRDTAQRRAAPPWLPLLLQQKHHRLACPRVHSHNQAPGQVLSCVSGGSRGRGQYAP